MIDTEGGTHTPPSLSLVWREAPEGKQPGRPQATTAPSRPCAEGGQGGAPIGQPSAGRGGDWRARARGRSETRGAPGAMGWRRAAGAGGAGLLVGLVLLVALLLLRAGLVHPPPAPTFWAPRAAAGPAFDEQELVRALRGEGRGARALC